VADGGATAKALDYSLNHWTALTRNLLDGECPSTTTSRKPDPSLGDGAPAWLFAGSELAASRSDRDEPVQSAKLNGHDRTLPAATCWSAADASASASTSSAASLTAPA